MSNLSLVLHNTDDLRLEERNYPLAPGPGEVELSTSFTGICGTDIHFYGEGGIPPAFIIVDPIVPGHEASGVVTKLGQGVTNLKIGDRVAIEPALSCLKCRYCRIGRYNLCPAMRFIGLTPSVDGACRRQFIHPADNCFKLPDNVSLEEGALIEPLSCGAHAVARAGVKAGDRVLVCGAGPIAFLSMMAARVAGAIEICVTGRTEAKLAIAKQFGANHTLCIDSSDVKHLAAKVKDLFGCQPDVTIECSGAIASIQLAVHATRPGGVVMLYGCGPNEMELPILTAALNEIDIKGAILAPNQFQPSIDLVSSGIIDVKPLITRQFDLEEAKEAFDFKRNNPTALKVLIKCSQN